MTQPLALVLYEKLLPGSQLVNKLQDLNYRVQVLSEPALLIQCALQEKPLLVLSDLNSQHDKVLTELKRLRQNPETQHLPVIAFNAEDSAELRAAALAAGVTLLVSDVAILNHLPQLLEQALHVE